MSSPANNSHPYAIEDRRLQPIFEKIQARERLSYQDCLSLLRSPDLLSLGYLANLVRERLHGNVTYFSLNSHSNPAGCSLVYGSLEKFEDLAGQLVRLRELREETHSFSTFAPVAFDPEKSVLAHLPATSGFDDIKQIAISRLMLDNIPHIRAYWNAMTASIAQVAQRFGADDLDGTLAEDSATGDLALAAAQVSRRKNIMRLIRECGREPVELDTTGGTLDENKSSFNVLV